MQEKKMKNELIRGCQKQQKNSILIILIHSNSLLPNQYYFMVNTQNGKQALESGDDVPSSSDSQPYRQLEKQSSHCQMDLQKSSLFCKSSVANYNIKKQAKLIIAALNKEFKSNNPKFLEKRLQILVDLITGCSQAPNFDYNHKQEQSYKKSSTKIVKFGRLTKSNGPKTIILSPQRDRCSEINTSFSLTVLNFSGKIDYLISNISKFEDFNNYFFEAKSRAKIWFLAVEEIDSIKSIMGKNAQTLQKLLQGFQTLELSQVKIKQWTQNTLLFQSNCKNIQTSTYNRLLNTFQNNLSTFYFVKKSLNRNLLKLKNKQKAQIYKSYLPFAHNIVSPYIQLNQMPYNQQIQLFYPRLECFFKELRQIGIKNCKDTENVMNTHIPESLQNAHSCWMCKKRCFVSCLGCSVAQGKSVCLCLECYSPYHSSMSFEKEIEKASNSLDKWEKLELRVDMQLQRQEDQFIAPCMQNLKKQER